MKKTSTVLTVIALLAGVASGYSQGEIMFMAGGPSSPGFKQVIYDQNAANTGTIVTYGGYTVSELQGSSSGGVETPTGTTVYAGSLLTGSGYSAELLGADGFNDSLDSLAPLLLTSGQPAVLNFYTGGPPSGTISGALDVVTGATGGPETIAIAVWNNLGGTVTSLAAAQAGDVNNLDPWGISALANITSEAPPNTPTEMSTASNLNLSFSLGTEIPEPGTISLGVLGASAFLFRRRK
ncbi:MAG: PEP-CTERM sorting domain-containing protein [Limisphaerales bacterium]